MGIIMRNLKSANTWVNKKKTGVKRKTYDIKLRTLHTPGLSGWGVLTFDLTRYQPSQVQFCGVNAFGVVTGLLRFFGPVWCKISKITYYLATKIGTISNWQLAILYSQYQLNRYFNIHIWCCSKSVLWKPFKPIQCIGLLHRTNSEWKTVEQHSVNPWKLKLSHG